MTNDKLSIIFSTLLVLFAIVGMLTIGIGIHELQHVYDARSLNITESRLCVFQLENITYNPSGYYRYYFPESETTTQEKVMRYSEIKAYIAFAIIVFIGACSIFYLIFNFRKPQSLNSL